MRLRSLRVAPTTPEDAAPEPLEGWHPDPDGTHDARYFSQGVPTNRVRDGDHFSWDPPPGPGPSPVDPGPLPPGTGTVAPGGTTPSTSPQPAGPPPAWYPDPTQPGFMRYWDGEQWADSVVAMPPVASERDPGGLADPTAAGERARHAGIAAGTVTDPGAEGATALAVLDDAHHVLVPGEDDVAGSSITRRHGFRLVTGEVPPVYDRVAVECRDGSVVDATILVAPALPDVRLFVALVASPPARLVATRFGGVHGIFVDLGDRPGDPARSPSQDAPLRLRSLA